MEDCFWKNGVGFSCSQCSACCRYEPGFVFLYEKDITPLLTVLNLDFASFVEKYCRWVDLHDGYEYLSLIETAKYDCIFWKDGCSVYEARPLQCRAFPFWVDALSSLDSWLGTTAGCNACIKLYASPEKQLENEAAPVEYPTSSENALKGDATFFSPARIAAIRNEQLSSRKIKRPKA